MDKLELDMAGKAFVRSTDYQGIQFVKRLKKLDVSEACMCRYDILMW